jgi:hypothetical protein
MLIRWFELAVRLHCLWCQPHAGYAAAIGPGSGGTFVLTEQGFPGGSAMVEIASGA